MTDISPNDHELIRRYLAGRLAEAEADMLQTRIVEDPVFRNEVELTAALKDGMRELDGRGEIRALLANRDASRRRLQLAAAASLGAIALGFASFLLIERDEPSKGTVTETLRFAPTRGAESKADLVWQRNDGVTRFEMRFDVGPRPAESYEVTIARADGPGTTRLLSRTAVTSAEGDVVLPVDETLFEPGLYEIHLLPMPATARSESVHYTLLIH